MAIAMVQRFRCATVIAVPIPVRIAGRAAEAARRRHGAAMLVLLMPAEPRRLVAIYMPGVQAPGFAVNSGFEVTDHSG